MLLVEETSDEHLISKFVQLFCKSSCQQEMDRYISIDVEKLAVVSLVSYVVSRLINL